MRPQHLVRAPVFVIALVTSLASPRSAVAQVAYDFPNGRVQVLGLKRWTLRMLQDSIRHYVPGQELHDAACMVILRDSMHFAEASVEHFFMAPPTTPGAKQLLIIKLIEPQDAALVKWDVRERSDFSSLLPDYAPLVIPVTDSTGGVWMGRLVNWMQFYHSDSATRSTVLARAPDSARVDARRFWGFLNARRSETDRVRAMRVLQMDGFFVNRMVASAVLSNFATNDSTWWTLVRTLRDPHESARDFAAVALEQLAERPINWAPVATDLRLLLGGTNLPAMGVVLRTLDRTAVNPSLAGSLLHGNADWVLATLASEHPRDSEAAHRLLVRLNRGVDLGSTRASWAEWVAVR
jgi:hypothetical protein